MNRTILSTIISSMFGVRYAVEPNVGDASTVKPEEARTFLSEFGHAPETLKTLKDEDVVKLHSTVNASLTKHAPKPQEPTGDVDLKLPEKTTLTQPDLDDIKRFAKDNKVSQKEAERILIREQTAEVRAATKSLAAAEREANGWVEAVTKDPEIGGANLVETQRLANLAIEKFVKPNAELVKLLRGAEDGKNADGTPKYKNGFGQHPAVVRLLRTIGAAMSEDKGINGKGPGGGAPKDAATVLYGGTPNQ